MESIWEIDGAATKEIQGFYFGDLDPVGISIFLSLQKKNIIPVAPF